MAPTPYAELHCHTNFSFLDGASAPDELVERAVALGLTGLAVTDHNGLYGAVRFVSAAEAVGLHPVVGLEIELLDAAVADPDRIVVPPRRPRRPAAAAPAVPLDPGCDRGPAAPPPPDPCPPARPSRAGQGGPARHRRAGPRPASRPARPVAGRLAQPVPAGVAGQHGRHEGRPALQPGAPRRAHRGARGAVRLSRRGAGPPPPDGRPRWRPRRRRALRDALRARRRDGHERLLHRAVAPPPARRRLAGRRVGRPGRGRRAAGRRRQRRPLRRARGPRAGRRPDRHPPRPVARDARGPAPAGRRVVAEVGFGDGGARCVARRRGGSVVGGGDVDGGRARGVVLGRSRLRAVPLPGLPGAGRRDAVLVPRRSCAGRAPGSATTR